MSLTESCIAAIVITTATAVALPSMNRARQIYTLRSAAYDVAARLHFTRISAISRSCDCRVVVTSATTYAIECDLPDKGSWQIIEKRTVPRGITVEANARPEFHRRGNVSPAATITLRNTAGASRRVVVNVNGRVRIQ